MARRAATELRDIREDQHTPVGPEYFLNVLKRVLVDKQLPLSLQDHERLLVKAYCIMAPEELIYAAGAAPSGFAEIALNQPNSLKTLCPGMAAQW